MSPLTHDLSDLPYLHSLILALCHRNATEDLEPAPLKALDEDTCMRDSTPDLDRISSSSKSASMWLLSLYRPRPPEELRFDSGRTRRDVLIVGDETLVSLRVEPAPGPRTGPGVGEDRRVAGLTSWI